MGCPAAPRERPRQRRPGRPPAACSNGWRATGLVDARLRPLLATPGEPRDDPGGLCWPRPLMVAMRVRGRCAQGQRQPILQLTIDSADVEGRWDIALRDLEQAMGLDGDGDGRSRGASWRRSVPPRRLCPVSARPGRARERPAGSSPARSWSTSTATAPMSCSGSGPSARRRPTSSASTTGCCSTWTRCTAVWSGLPAGEQLPYRRAVARAALGHDSGVAASPDLLAQLAQFALAGRSGTSGRASTTSCS